MNDHRENHYHDDKSGGEMLSEILHLLFRLLIKSTKNLLQLIAKGLLLLWQLVRFGIRKCIQFWNRNSTQQKVRLAIDWTKWFIKACLVGLVLAVKWLCLGTVWLAKAVVKGCIHLRPTIIYIGNATVRLLQLMGKGCMALWHGIISFCNGRRQAYQRFRKTKGFKGLLIDTKGYLQKQLDDYMDEGQEDKESNAVGYGEYFTDEGGRNGSKSSLGHRIYNGVNRILDNE